MSNILAWTALAWASLAWAIGAIALLRRLQGRHQFLAHTGLTTSKRPVLLMRPCAGDEPKLEHCLCSILATRHQVEIHVVIAVSEADDDSMPVAKRACDKLNAAGMPTSIEIHPPQGPNRKAAILAGISSTRYHSYDVVLNADSNVDLEGFDIDALIAPLRNDPRIGAVWAPPTVQITERNLGSLGSRAVLSGSLHAFGLLAGIDPEGLVGKLFALRSQDLEAIGGFIELTDYLGEDTELSRRLRARGLSVLPLPWPVLSHSRHRRLGDTVAQHARWMAVIRSQRLPLLFTYPLFFCGTPLILCLAIVGMFGAPRIATVAIMTALLGRLFVALAAQALSARRPSVWAGLLDAALADVVLLIAFGRSLVTTRVQWRGHRLRISRGGKLVEDTTPLT